MIQELIREVAVLVITFIVTVTSIVLSKFKISKKNNKMLKIVDTLIMIAEKTGLNGEDKKAFVLESFTNMKVGKIDNICEYIDDKINLANTINVKQSIINEVISEELNEQQIAQEEEDNLVVDYVDERIREKNMVRLERDYDIALSRINELEQIIATNEDTIDKLRNEVVYNVKEVERLKEVEQHLATKVNQGNHDLLSERELNKHLQEKLQNNESILRMREEQIVKLRG